MLFVVVLLGMAPIVVFSMFMLDLALSIATGTLALPYHLNKSTITLRGGISDNGARCGAFCVYAAASFSRAAWNVGAALSFKPNVL